MNTSTSTTAATTGYALPCAGGCGYVATSKLDGNSHWAECAIAQAERAAFVQRRMERFGYV